MIVGYFFDDDQNVFQTRHAGSVEAKRGCVYSVSENDRVFHYRVCWRFVSCYCSRAIEFVRAGHPFLTERPVFHPFCPAPRWTSKRNDKCPVFWSHGETSVENSVKYVSPDDFFCIQILHNSISAPLGELTTLPTLQSAREGIPPSHSPLLDAFALEAFGVEGRCWQPVPFLCEQEVATLALNDHIGLVL